MNGMSVCLSERVRESDRAAEKLCHTDMTVK